MDIKINIEKQKMYLKKEPYEGPYIVSDSLNYLQCIFYFSEDWTDFAKTIIFKDDVGNAYSVLLENDACIVPYEVLTGNNFKISAFGTNNGVRITTNEITVPIIPSGYEEGKTPTKPVPTAYELILDKLRQIGTLLRLKTNNKKTLVDAINEVKEDINANSVNNTLIELKCFKPIAEDVGNKTITLDSVEGLRVGYQLVKAKYDANGDFAGWQSRQISEINGNVVTLAGVFSYHPDYSTEYEPTIRNGVVFSDCLFDDNLNPIGTTDLQLEEDDYKYVHLEGLNNNGVITSLVSGVGNTAKAFDSIIIGAECETTAIEGVAIGNSCKAKFKRAVAIGSGASAEGLSSVALVGGKATGSNSISIGSGSESNGNYSISIGPRCKSNNVSAFSIGHYVEANGYGAFAHGSSTKANGQSSDSGGYETEANGDFSISRGMRTKANGYLSYAGGYQTIATGTGAFAYGGGEYSADGTPLNLLEANGDYSFAVGWGGDADGQCSAVFNQDNKVEGMNSTAMGHRNTVNGESSFCGGRFSEVYGENCFGFGSYIVIDNTSEDTFVIGRYNDTLTKDYAFVVGNGDTKTTRRSNAFTVDWNGNGVFSGDVRIKNSEGVVISLLNKIAELEERLAALESIAKE